MKSNRAEIKAGKRERMKVLIAKFINRPQQPFRVIKIGDRRTVDGRSRVA